MTLPSPGARSRALAATLLFVAATACSEAPSDTAASGVTAEPMAHEGMPEEVVVPEGVLYTVDDVRFMQGMIAHHAQAIHMTHLAETRGASSRLLTLAQKIDQSQAAEIELMQGWLREKDQFAPDTASYHTMMMPGMLTPEQLDQLSAADGAEFDRLFLELMIQHHQGAIQMVADLLGNPRAAQDVDVNVFANDVHLVQTTEIELMREMLSDL
jgi:uncharacterized protein (DUF305 family)